MSVSLDCFGQSDIGRVRHENEDQFLIAALSKQLHISQTSLPEGHAADWWSRAGRVTCSWSPTGWAGSRRRRDRQWPRGRNRVVVRHPHDALVLPLSGRP